MGSAFEHLTKSRLDSPPDPRAVIRNPPVPGRCGRPARRVPQPWRPHVRPGDASRGRLSDLDLQSYNFISLVIAN